MPLIDPQRTLDALAALGISASYSPHSRRFYQSGTEIDPAAEIELSEWSRREVEEVEPEFRPIPHLSDPQSLPDPTEYPVLYEGIGFADEKSFRDYLYMAEEADANELVHDRYRKFEPGVFGG
jgi:hypothetical protein